MIIELTKENFDREVLDARIPAMVDFWAAWCGPCRMIMSIIDELSVEYEGRVKIGKLNVDENRDIAIKYEIMSIPTLKFFKEGKVVDEIVGLVSKDVLKKKLEGMIGV
ncbi:TPA: thioredoxin [bacterium]|nr:thioredoxin [bacterium]